MVCFAGPGEASTSSYHNLASDMLNIFSKSPAETVGILRILLTGPSSEVDERTWQVVRGWAGLCFLDSPASCGNTSQAGHSPLCTVSAC